MITEKENIFFAESTQGFKGMSGKTALLQSSMPPKIIEATLK